MGLLVDGIWHDTWYDTKKSKGKFEREQAAFRNWVTADGSPGPSGRGGFKAESGRYHLYVSYACPWAHRTLIFRQVKGLLEHISVSVVHPYMLTQGWEFRTDEESYRDHLFGAAYMHQIYTRAKSDYSGRVTVPVLWDKHTNTIVSNESSEIIRMLNSAFHDLVGEGDDFYPEGLRPQIDAINEKVYHNINNGVYRAGFATTKEAYEEAFTDLFRTLDEMETLLGKNRYLTGSVLTEADWRLFTTLVRFDPVYVGHFKCNLRRIADYPNLANYLRDLYQREGVADTVFMHDIKQHYYYSHESINPTRIVPLGPELNYETSHDRDRFEVG